jgi:hypothetical protein
LRAFTQLKAGEFYDAWCELEKTELALANLERHDTASWHEFRLDFIQEHTARWQSLFPYKMFYSPELLHKEKVCSICQQVVVPHAFCGHRAGEIYNGELCYRIITKLDVLGISMVQPSPKVLRPLLERQRDWQDARPVQLRAGGIPHQSTARTV